MRISERIEGTIENWRIKWGDTLKGWMASWVMRGFNEFLDHMEPEGIELLHSSLATIADHPATPQDIKDLIGKLEEGKHPLPLLVLIPIAVIIFIPMITAIFQPLGNLFRYAQERLFHSHRLDPATLIRIWLRDKPAYDKFFDDLKDQGWNDERIEIARELAKIVPPVADMVRFADFSAFDPEVIARWRQFYDAPDWVSDPMSLVGISNEEPRDWANKYWFSHYVQPGRYELGEMFRRSESWRTGDTAEDAAKLAELGVTEDDLTLAYRTMAYSEFWQKRLLELAKEIPTRVDVRRWWDMRTIDETELRSLYQRQGYFGKDLDNYVLWTKVYVAFPDLMARWKNGWITEDDVRRELTALGMPAARVDEMIETKIKPQEPERVTEGRALTKTEIYKGVKKELITWEQGIELLQDLGYDEDEADYILAVNVGVLTGSPETFEEFKDWTTKYKLATGREAKPMPEELKKAAAEVVRLTGEVEALERSSEEEQRLVINVPQVPEAAAKRLKGLTVKLHRGEAELARVKAEYDAKVAEWRRGLPE